MEESDNRELIDEATRQLEASNALVTRLKDMLQEKSVNAEVGAAVRSNNEWWEVSDVAKKLKVEIRPGKVIGRNQLYNFMMNTGMAHYKKDFVSGSHYYAPIQRHEDAQRLKLGVTETKQENRQGEIISNHRLLVGTEKGLPYLMKKLLAAVEEGLLEEHCSSWRAHRGWE